MSTRLGLGWGARLRLRLDRQRDGLLGVVGDVGCIQHTGYLAHTAGTTHIGLDTRKIGEVK